MGLVPRVVSTYWVIPRHIYKSNLAGETDTGVYKRRVVSFPLKWPHGKTDVRYTMNWPLFFSTFSLIFVAELPDKTAFATLLMATRGRPFAIFVGVAAAFCIQSLVAVAFGSVIGLLPERWIHLGAGILFLAFAAHTWFHHDEEEAETEATTPSISGRMKFFKSAWKAFIVIFIAEWGDLTQLATASIAAHYHDSLATVFLASVLALWAVTALAIFVGHKVRHVIHAKGLKYASAAVFTLVGLYFIFTWF